MASTQNIENLYWFGTEPYVKLPESYEYMFLNAKVLQKAYNKGYASYYPTR